MFIINEEKLTEVETSTVEKKEQPEFSRHDFGWESLASVEESRQNQLISEVYSLMNTGNDEKIEFIKKEWQSLSEEGIDDALEERFNQAIHRYETRHKRIEEAQAIKRKLIQDAANVKDSTDWSKTSAYLQELQKAWKEAGFAGQDIDQELWEEFRGHNDVFFEKRSEHYAAMADNRQDALGIKEKLIEEVNVLKESTNWKQTSIDMRNLMTRWKEAGFAGREHEDALWERFNEGRQYFYQKQREFFDEMREEQAKARGAKMGIIERSEELVKNFNSETVRAEMEKLFEEWKQVGHSGREHEEKLWNQFRAVQDEFYDRLKNRDQSIQVQREEEIQDETETLEVRINALESVNEKIVNRLNTLIGQALSNDSEQLQQEIQELQSALEENKGKIVEYEDRIHELNR